MAEERYSESKETAISLYSSKEKFVLLQLSSLPVNGKWPIVFSSYFSKGIVRVAVNAGLAAGQFNTRPLAG